MSYGLPDDWYIEPTGESRILDQEKVAAKIEQLRSILRDIWEDGMQDGLPDDVRNKVDAEVGDECRAKS